MPGDEVSRKAHWEQVYADKSPLEVSWYQAEPTLSLSFIDRFGLAKDAAIIDVGGGASVLVDRLCERGFRRLAVLDISAQALDHAKARLGAKGENIEWFEADVTAFRAPHSYALWHDRAVFHFLTQAEDRKRYVEALRRTLEPGGGLIMATFATDGPLKCSGLDVVRYDAEKLTAELGAEFELLEQATELHITPANKTQRFRYFRFRRSL